MKLYLLFLVKSVLVVDNCCEAIQIEDFYGAFSSKKKAKDFQNKLEKKLLKTKNGFFTINETTIDDPEQIGYIKLLLK